MVLENYTILNTECFITALQKINDNQKGFLIVEDDKGTVLGTLTDGDIRRAFLNGKKLKDTVEGSYKKKFTFVNIEDVYKRQVPECAARKGRKSAGNRAVQRRVVFCAG